MASAREQTKMIEHELKRVRGEIEKLRVEEALLQKMLNKMNGVEEAPEAAPRKARSSNVKPLVLDIMRNAGAEGATSIEVDEQVKARIPSVARDTVGSILSRLKAEGALVFNGERYFEKQFAPKPENAFEKSVLRAVVS